MQRRSVQFRPGQFPTRTTLSGARKRWGFRQMPYGKDSAPYADECGFCAECGTKCPRMSTADPTRAPVGTDGGLACSTARRRRLSLFPSTSVAFCNVQLQQLACREGGAALLVVRTEPPLHRRCSVEGKKRLRVWAIDIAGENQATSQKLFPRWAEGPTEEERRRPSNSEGAQAGERAQGGSKQ